MNVYGQLKQAILENTATDFTNTVKGFIWFNSTSNNAKMYDGSAIRTVADTSSTQTLTNKTLTSPAITTPTGIVKGDVGLGNVQNVDTTIAANITQTSSLQFVTSSNVTQWNSATVIHQDTYTNLVTWALTASNASIGFSTDTKLLYYVASNLLNEVAVNKTINGTITSTQLSVGTTAVRATVSGSAPNASRKRLLITPSPLNNGAIYLGGSSVTIANGKQIIGPDTLELDWDASDYFLISDTASQTVSIVEVV